MINKQKMNEAINYIEECLSRMKEPNQKNANGGDWQAGACYWRLAKVIEYVDEVLEQIEGIQHADVIRITHGVLTKNKHITKETINKRRFFTYFDLLSIRARNCLISEDILTIDTLRYVYATRQLKRIPNLGAATEIEIVNWMEKYFPKETEDTTQ